MAYFLAVQQQTQQEAVRQRERDSETTKVPGQKHL